MREEDANLCAVCAHAISTKKSLFVFRACLFPDVLLGLE